MSELGNKKVFSENLKYYMMLHNINRIKMCDDLQLNYSTVRDWVNSRAYPRIDKIEILANYFRIKKSDLIEAKDPIIEEIERDSVLYKEILNSAKNKTEEELLVKCTMLNDINQEKVIELVDMYLKEQDDYSDKNANGKWVKP